MEDIECGYVPKRTTLQKCFLFLRSLIHLFFCVQFYVVVVYAVYILLNNYDNENDVLRTLCVHSYAFGTNWNVCFQTVFLTLSLTYDVLEWLDRHETELAKKLKYYRDVLFCGLVLPMTMFISTMFWTVFLIDRELVFPEVYDKIVPWWFNHCVHTNIAIVVLLETLIQSRRYPTNLKLEVIINGTVGVLYAIVYYSIYFFAHRWLYGVFGIMTWWQVCLYQILIWGSCFVFYFIQFPINRLFHREEDSMTKEEVTEQKNGISEVKTVIPEVKLNGEEKPADPDSMPFSNKSWSLKYRSMRSQIENSSL
ncbi:hypothetical protein O3G_MSEX003365 [Manduca sexta]|uniref:Androgen-dependent TFPI-regulating protein n=1 Tax=Manduca sexta TaxID=7130 RepID=A0A921YTH9_MANSE|nr:hypothetical protein O3G_MSEX003365 [Manduca sexta]